MKGSKKDGMESCRIDSGIDISSSPSFNLFLLCVHLYGDVEESFLGKELDCG